MRRAAGSGGARAADQAVRQRPCAVRAAAAAPPPPPPPPPRVDVLVLDATNILCAAAADAARWRHAAGPSTAAAFADYLRLLAAAAAPRLTIVAVFDPPGGPDGRARDAEGGGGYLRRRKRLRPAGGAGASAGKLVPFMRTVEAGGGVCLVAAGGREADDAIGAVLDVVARRGCFAAVASADADAQQALSERVAWLRLGPPGAGAPAGLAWETAAAFEARMGFPPAAYVDFLALTGKKEAGVGGAGVGARPAVRLLAEHGSLAAAAEAERAGRLNGWAPAVRAALRPGAAAERVARNRALLALRRDDAALPPAGAAALEAALDAALAAPPPAREAPALNSAALARLHPFHAARWRRAAPLAARLAAAVEGAVAGGAAPGGLPVDVLLPGGRPAFVLLDLDFEPGAEAARRRADAGGASNLGAALLDGAPAAAAGVGGALRRHLAAVRRAAGAAPACVPHWVSF
jgi:hypothetical protein